MVVALALVGITACASNNDSNSCTYLPNLGFYSVDPEQLTLAVASPWFPDDRSPYLILWDVADQPDLSVMLKKLFDQSPIHFDESRAECSNAKIRFFALQISVNDWSEYWLLAQEHQGFSVAIVFPGLDAPARYNTVGFAFLADDSDVASIRCGCMAR
jgi:hypothetical protein